MIKSYKSCFGKRDSFFYRRFATLGLYIQSRFRNRTNKNEFNSGLQPSEQGPDVDTPPLRDGAEIIRAFSPFGQWLIVMYQQFVDIFKRQKCVSSSLTS